MAHPLPHLHLLPLLLPHPHPLLLLLPLLPQALKP